MSFPGREAMHETAEPGTEFLAGRWAQRLWQLDKQAHVDVQRFAQEALTELRNLLQADTTALVVSTGGRWRAEVFCGPAISLPERALSHCLAEEHVLKEGSSWLLPVHWSSAAAILIHNAHVVLHPESLDAMRRLWNSCYAQVAHSQTHYQRSQQLKTILGIVAEWQATLQTDVLLERMAQAATRLLSCQRASIFLWDRANHTLVGRPALGVEGGELRVADDRGVVGHVVRTGQPQRINIDEDQSVIDRTVDEKLHFRTESLLCVPLVGRDGRIFGAFEMINKHNGVFTDEDQRLLTELARHASIALENTQHFQRLLESRNQWANEAAQQVVLLGKHPAMEKLRATIQRVAETDLAVLLLGENGTGKEVVCRMIHALSRRRNEPLVAVNCAALPETLLESELFGHEQGAFTDARQTRPGKFEVAGHGTLFLDEIGELSLAGQAKLLRAIEEKTIQRVGGTQPIVIHARIVAATNRDLLALVHQQRFRQDLYYRLNVVTLHLPPLRDRGDDVLLLAEHFLSDFCSKAGRPLLKLTHQARQRLREYSWPGNVRELRNIMERFAYLHPREVIDAADIDPLLTLWGATSDANNVTLQQATRQFQIRLIQEHLQRAKGSVARAARTLGMHRANLYRKMRQLGMPIIANESEGND
jgi:transcriptional regulator with GAF, ATPase, and Fis domain